MLQKLLLYFWTVLFIIFSLLYPFSAKIPSFSFRKLQTNFGWWWSSKKVFTTNFAG